MNTWLRRLWCDLFHGAKDLMTPINGRVRCRRCLVVRVVDWPTTHDAALEEALKGKA